MVPLPEKSFDKSQSVVKPANTSNRSRCRRVVRIRNLEPGYDLDGRTAYGGGCDVLRGGNAKCMIDDRQSLYAGRPPVSSFLSVCRGTWCPIAALDQDATRNDTERWLIRV